MTQVQHFVSRTKNRERWDVQTMWAYDLDLWPWRSWRLPLMRVCLLHLHINFEVLRPYRLEDMTHFACLGWSACNPDRWSFDRETDVQCSTCHWVPSCQLRWCYDYLFSIYGPFGQHGSDWSRERMILTFDLGGHGACGWCGSSSSIRIPSLKFVSFAIWKIYMCVSMCVSINLPDLDLWPFGL